MKKLLKSCVSLLLVACMLLGVVPATMLTAHAAGNSAAGVQDVTGDGKITYVSFGDSVTNGYGMKGYFWPPEATSDYMNTFGFFRSPEVSYPSKIAQYLDNNTTMPVVHKPLAVSSYRMDEFHWLLDPENHVSDNFHSTRFSGWNQTLIRRMFAVNPNHESLSAKEKELLTYFNNTYGAKWNSNKSAQCADEIIGTEFRTSIAAADLITIDLGSNNFGTFVTQKLGDILGLDNMMGTDPFDIDLAVLVGAQEAAVLEGIINNMVAQMVGNSGGNADLAYTLTECLMYGYIGFCKYFDASMEDILKLNDKAEIIIIDCYPMLSGVQLAGNALGASADMDALYNMFVNMANLYARELSPYADRVVHATLVEDPELMIDYYAEYETNKAEGKFADTQNLDPIAFQAMNEVMMEVALGLDPDKPAHAAQFAPMLEGILTLDAQVNGIEQTLAPFIQQVDAGIADVVQTVTDAIEGVETAYGFVDMAAEAVGKAETGVKTALTGVIQAEEAIATAVESVALFNDKVLPMLEDSLFGNPDLMDVFANDIDVNDDPENLADDSNLTTVTLIKSQIPKDVFEALGFEYNNANKTLLATEVYRMAKVYFNVYYELLYDENGEPIKDGDGYYSYKIKDGADIEEARMAATLYGMSAVLVVTEGMAPEKADATAALAYQLASLEKAGKHDDAVIAAMMTEVDETTARLGYGLYKVYIANGGTITTNESNEVVYTETAFVAATKAAIQNGMSDDQRNMILGMLDLKDNEENRAYIANLVYDLGKAADKNAAAASVMTLIVGEDNAQMAMQLYDVYSSMVGTDGKDAAFAATVIAALKGNGFTQEVAVAVYATYTKTATPEQQKLAYSTLLLANKDTVEKKIEEQFSGATITVDQALTDAIAAIHVDKLNGQYKDPSVQKVVTTLMVALGLADSADKAAELYGQYAMYKGLPTTLCKIAKLDTIYFDVLLDASANASGGAIDFTSVINGFKMGTLALDEPAANASDAEWAAFKHDSALAILYFRFLARTGLFTHPSADGHGQLWDAIKPVMDKLYQAAPADSDIDVTADTKILILGDDVAAAENSYASQLKAGTVTNLAKAGFRMDDIRALVDDSYNGDAYTAAILGDAKKADYKAAVKESDVIILDAGSMNMGMVGHQIANYLAGKGTYTMNFGDLSIMGAPARYLGAYVDGFMGAVQGGYQNNVSPNGAVMLAVKAEGYGFASFAEHLDKTVAAIRALNADAHIILLGQDESFMASTNVGGTYNLGGRINSQLSKMNGHLETFAENNANVIYIDMSDIESGTSNANLATVTMAQVLATELPNANGQTTMAKRIGCILGSHSVSEATEITFAWNDDNTATASFKCSACDTECTEQAEIKELVKKATCTERGSVTYVASYQGYIYNETKTVDGEFASHSGKLFKGQAATCSTAGWLDCYQCESCEAYFTDEACKNSIANYDDWKVGAGKIDATGEHIYVPGEYIWNETNTECTVVGTCGCSVIATAEATVTSMVTIEPKCGVMGTTTYTANFTEAWAVDQTKDVQNIPALTHDFADPTYDFSKDGNTCTAKRICKHDATHVETAIATISSTVTTPAECEEMGTTTYTATFTETWADTQTLAVQDIPALNHAFGEWTTEDDVSKRVCSACGYTESKFATADGNVEIELPEQADGLTLNVDQVSEASDERYILVEETFEEYAEEEDISVTVLKTFDITLDNKDGVHQQPDGTLKVKLPLGSDKDGSYKVYRVDDDGKLTDMEAVRQGSHMVFNTDHLSLYVIVEINEHKHDLKLNKAVEATCIDAGSKAYYTCSGCDLWFEDEAGTTEIKDKTSVVVPKLDHKWKDATCTAPKTCSVCGATEGLRLSHTYVNTVTEPTCTEQGYTTRTCSGCEHSYQFGFVAALGHSWDEGKVTIEATEDKAGERVFTCKTCEETKTEVIPALGHTHNYTSVVTAPTCTEKGYTTYSCACGHTYIADEVPATGHTIEKGICTVCGVEDPAEAGFFKLYGANMLLGNNLAMNFYIDPADLEFGEDYYAVITKEYADDREDLVVKIDVEDWEEAYGMYRISLDKIAAKEMADDVIVVIYNGDDEQVSKTWVDSIRDYTMRMLKKEEAETEPNEELLALYVEMLNYGAAAQTHFEYNENDLANNELTAEQNAYGVGPVEMGDFRVKGTGYVGTNLTLENNILMNFFFNNIPAEHDDMYAIATYVDHYGKAQEIKIEGENFAKHDGSTWKISVAGLVIADCKELVTVKVFDANGNVVASVVDSIESYTARMDDDGPLYIAIMKFAVAAYESFH